MTYLPLIVSGFFVAIGIVRHVRRKRYVEELTRRLLKMKAETWFRQYAARSGMTVEELRELGQDVLSCDCGEEGCRGWKCVRVERRAFDIVAYGAAVDGVIDDYKAITAAMYAARDWITEDLERRAVVMSSKPGVARVSHSIGIPAHVTWEGFDWRRD